jgi:drug/metabolite transporter (DMT)-like permease
MFAALLTTVLFSISAVTANRTTRFLSGSEANFWRLVCATFFLALYAHTFGKGLSGNAFTIFFISGCIGFGVGDLALFQAYPRLGSRLTILLVQCLAAPFAALTEWLWLHTTLSWWQVLYGLTILAGVALALSPSRHLELSPKQIWQGTLFGALAAVGQGMGAVLSRIAYNKLSAAGQDIDGVTAAYQRILGGVTLVTLFLLFIRRPNFAFNQPTRQADPARNVVTSEEIRGRVWPWIIATALAGPTLGVSCMQWALKTNPTGIVLPVVAITPIVIIPFARYMEGERPTIRSLIGGIVAVAGVVGLTLVTHR